VTENRTAGATVRPRTGAEVSSTVDFQRLFGGLPTAYLVMTPDLVIAEVNPAYLQLLDRNREELVGTPVFEAFPPSPDALAPDGTNPLRTSFERVRDTGEPDVMPLLKYDVVDADSGEHQERFWSLIHSALRGPDGEIALVLQRVEDVTDYVRSRRGLGSAGDPDLEQRITDVEAQLYNRVQQLEAAERAATAAVLALEASERRARAVLDTAVDAILTFDAEGRIESVNRAAEEMFGFPAEELLGRDVSMLMLDVQLPATEPRDGPWMPSQRTPGRTREVVGRRRDGSTFPVQLAVSAVGSEPPSYAGVARDVTERKRLETQLRHQSAHDPLTGLANRTLLMERLEVLADQLATRPGLLALYFVDLDRFKMVNDSLGHEAGDLLLRQTAARLRGAVRPEDLVARIGGDEFVIVCGDLHDLLEAETVARRLVSTLAEPLHLQGQEVFVTASIGVVTDDGRRAAAELLADADAAMYTSKQTGRGRYSVVDDEARATFADRVQLSSQLVRALEREELRAHYQAVVDLRSQDVVGTEALLRWQHPTRGVLAPAAFLDLAGDLGLSAELDSWMLVTACLQAAEWSRAVGRPLGVCVNLSSRSLADRRLTGTVARALDASGLPPGLLTLEITEGGLMQDASCTVRTLGSLRDLGVQLAIDDFGTGYSSLSYLQQFPVHALKIDRTFVGRLDGAGPDAADAAKIVRTIVSLASGLGLRTVAEGIETPAQLAAVTELGCDLGQGFLLGRPALADTLLDRAVTG
jgi:diguanylate cyclase (GGDEF)-like protein/PAS domain S-box-containing protein